MVRAGPGRVRNVFVGLQVGPAVLIWLAKKKALVTEWLLPAPCASLWLCGVLFNTVERVTARSLKLFL